MRFFFGLIGLVVVLAIVGTVVKQQLASQKAVVPALQVPGAPAPTGNVREQSQQIQQQVQDQLNQAAQQDAKRLQELDQ